MILALAGGLWQNPQTHSSGLKEFAINQTPKRNCAELMQELRAEGVADSEGR